MRVDIVRELIVRLMAAASHDGSITEEIAMEVERKFRNEFAGEAFYVKKKSALDAEKTQKLVVNAYIKSSDQPAQVAAENGISRSTLYRFLKR